MARNPSKTNKPGARKSVAKKSKPTKSRAQKRGSLKAPARKTTARKSPPRKRPIPPRKRRDQTILTKVKTVLQDTTEKLKALLPGESTTPEPSEPKPAE